MKDEEFMKAFIGEMKNDENNTDKAAKQISSFLYSHYTNFILSGFSEERSFMLCLAMLNNVMNDAKKKP